MSDTIPTYSDGALVQQIEGYLRARLTDHMLGVRVRLLFEARDEARRPAPPAKKEPRGWWTDAGSGGGAVIPLPDEQDDPHD